ncbi:MAG: ethanolamine utilization protein, partial [Synergistaceae bacterium]|nr:ethanolamine utilization protein [Synergistaceae bacterium]
MDESVRLKELVRSIVAEVLASLPADKRCCGQADGIRKDREPASGVLAVKKVGCIKMDPFPFDIGEASKGVFLKDIVTLGESPRLGIGVMEMKRTSFPWTLRYDEVDYILEGALEIKVNGKSV